MHETDELILVPSRITWRRISQWRHCCMWNNSKKWILKDWVAGLRTGLLWFKVRINIGHLQTLQINFRTHNMLEPCSLVQRLLDSASRILKIWLFWLWRMAFSGMLRYMALIRTKVSGELSASFIRVTRIGVLRTTLAVTSNRRTLRRNTEWAVRVDVVTELKEPGNGVMVSASKEERKGAQ
jgi:hypothetical protein